MKLSYKFHLFSISILVVMTSSVLVTGTMITNELSYNLQSQILNSELTKIRQTVFKALQRSGIRAAAQAADELQTNLTKTPHQMKHVHVYIVEAPDRAVFHSDYHLGDRIEWIDTEKLFQQREGDIEYTDQGILHYAVFTTLHPIEWLICLSIDKDEMYVKRNEYLRDIGLIAAVMLGISVLVVRFFANRYVRRLQSTLDCVQQIEKGDFKARIHPIAVDDEIGRLQTGVNTMSTRIQARTIERQQTEQALRESESRYRMVFENSPVSILEEDFSTVKKLFDDLKKRGITDIEAWIDRHPEWMRDCAASVEIIDVNQAAVALHKAASKEELATGLVRTFTPESFDTFRRELVNLWHGETEMAADAVIKTLAGEPRNVTVCFAVCPGHEKSLSKVIVSLVDITERKQMEEALAVQEREFRTLAENSPDNISRYDADCRTLYVNPALEQTLKRPASEMLGRTPIEVATINEFREYQQKIVDVFKTGKNEEMDLVLQGLGDGVRYHNIRFVPEKDADGTITGVQAIGRDLTKRKLAEETLRASEERFRTVVENSPIVVFSIDRNGVFTFSEGMGLTKLRIASGEVAGKSVFELYAHNPEIISNFNRALAGEDFTAVDEEAGLSFETRWTHIRDDVGEVTKIVGVSVDVTERKQAEEELKQHREHLEEMVKERTVELEAANKELEAFAYSVSHDLRAPLRHIDGFLELLEKKAGTVLDAKSRHYMDVISNSAKKMGLLIDSLLSFSRMGRQAMSLRQVALGRLVNDVIRELDPDTTGRDIAWHIADLPTVEGDAAMLQMAMSNLISNALKFTRHRKQARIEIGSLSGYNGEAVVFIRDNGVGFDMAYADKLFGVFQRLHRADDFEGNGIGLANVRRIIERHGGRVWAEGKVDEGATFYITLSEQ